MDASARPHLISNQLLICSVALSLEYLLAGNNADTKKIKSAHTRRVVVINLRRIQKLLRGQLTIEALGQLERLTKDSFKGDAYEAAETLATDTVGATNADDSCAASGAPATDTAGATNEDEEIHTY